MFGRRDINQWWLRCFVTHMYRYGDNIEDEWFIVYLLKCITECVPGTVVSVRDNSDGEFLLIEAADALPEWVTPDTAQDRVYLHNGHIHLIPQPSSPGMRTFLVACTNAHITPQTKCTVLWHVLSTKVRNRVY